MGYRSDVEILMYPQDPKDFAMLKLYVDENLPDKFTVESIDPTNIWPDGNKCLRLQFESVKWYPSYEDVAVYNECLNSWEERFGNPPKFHYEFIRIGEDQGDIDARYSEGARYALRVERRIASDFDFY